MCVGAFSGCGGCGEGESITDTDGVTLSGPSQVKAGESTEFTIEGQIGAKSGKRCPRTVQLSYLEVSKKGQDPKSRSRGQIKEITSPPVKTLANGACALSQPVKASLSISPGRTDEHRVKVTASLHPAAPDPPDANGGLAALAKALDQMETGVDSKVVTVEGEPGATPNQPPVADFIYSQEPAISGQPLGLDARKSRDPDGSIALYEWDLNGDGTFEKSSTSPTGVQVDSAASGRQPITLRVTDDKGLQTVSRQVTVSTVASGEAYTGGAPTFSPESPDTRQALTVGVRSTSPEPADSAALYCDDTSGGTLSAPRDGNTFTQPCRFSTAGFHLVHVRYDQSPGSSSSPHASTNFYRLAEVTASARSAARAGAKAKPLNVPLGLTGGKLVRVGKLKLKPTSATIRGMVGTGTGKGKVPKATPRRFRAALRTLASGRFAFRFNGSAKLDATTINLSGPGTLLVRSRSRRNRKTQVCLSIKAAGQFGQSRFKVLGATGRARGFAGSGTGPGIAIQKGTGRTTKVLLRPRRGKARRLNRSCRSLARLLNGKRR